MQKQKLENLIKDFSLENLDEFLWDANFKDEKQDLSDLNNEDIFSAVQKLGEIETEDNKKIIVAVAKVENDLSERSSRKKQYDLGKKILTNNSRCEAGIFVFYDKQGCFRFSLIHPTYSGTKRVLNSFKRYTYFVSKEQTNKTFLSQIGGGDFSTLENIKDAFSVEKVTKEFFKEYKNLFEELVEELDKNHTFKNEAARYNINTENFAKKLLGQIVFLCFLQKKCWLGASQNKSLKEGDENFLQNLFEKKYIKYSNFFNDVLEHLFYGALNKKSEKAGTFYRDYFKCQIPFLNGGLFDPEYEWQKTNIYLDDKIFERILKVFNQYNFTVDENSPIDQEIAIDPEMLGKVFENLLSENLRKGKGTYYTPREIVHYMCQESLINYLATVCVVGTGHCPVPTEDIAILIKHNEVGTRQCLVSTTIPKTISQNAKPIDEKLASIKVCDPACGSGAFLVGMLQEIIKARQVLQEFISGQTSEYDLKKETIQNCIYGVDIDPGAIEIAKLRLWLSLVVDYELEEIEPLPNLDYKIMQGNSLLEELVLGDTSIKLFDQEQNNSQVSLLENEEQASINKLNTLHKKYFALNDLDEKRKIKKEIDDIEYEVIKKSVEKEVKKLDQNNKKFEFVTMGGMKKKDVESFTKNLSKQGQIMNVLDEFKKTGVKPFFLWRLYFGDVFENGGFDVVIANPPYGANIDDMVETYKMFYKDVIKSYADIFKIFFAHGLNICKDSGIEIFITPNTFLAQPRYKDLRKFLIDYNTYKILNLGEKVFDDVVVPVCVTMIKNEKSNGSYNFADISFQNKFIDNLSEIEFNKISIEDVLKFKDLSLLQKIILNKDEVYFDQALEIKDAGIQYHRSGIGLKNKGGNDLYERIFSDNKKKFKKSKPTWYGKLIDTYYLHSDTNECFNLNYKDVLKNNESVSFSKEAFATKEKILWRQTAPYLKATIDNSSVWFRNTIQCCWVKNEYKNKLNLKYVLAIINSSYIKYLYNELVNESGRVFPQVKITHVKKLPLKIINIKHQKPLIKLVDQILKKKKDNPEADVGKLEREIDEMVYKLYDLNKEEIKIIENK